MTANPTELEARAREIDPQEVEVSVWPATREGQHVGMPHGVRVLHKPTGLSVIYDKERSQHRNRTIALGYLARALSQPAEPSDAAVERVARAMYAAKDSNPMWDQFFGTVRDHYTNMARAAIAAMRGEG